MEAPMRRPRITSCVYLAIVLCTCGSIGSGAPAGANVSIDALLGEAVALPPAPQVIAAAAAAAAAPTYREVGIASWYGGRHQGRLTASGEVFDENRLTAAHRKLPLDTKARVTNLENGRSVEVKVNDRGPYIHGRVIDLSTRAAQELGMTQRGLALVRIEVLRKKTASSAMN
jgi:rare lipoprotein A